MTTNENIIPRWLSSAFRYSPVPRRYTIEASALALRPGYFPAQLVIVDSVTMEDMTYTQIHKITAKGELQSVVYTSAAGGLTLVIHND